MPHRSYELVTPQQAARNLAERTRALRLARNWSRTTFSRRAGVTAASLKRFETSAKISLENLLKLVAALDRLGEFEDLLRPPPAASMAELEARASSPARKRGRK